MGYKYRINPLSRRHERFQEGTFFVSYTFASTAARDAYFVSNPNDLEEWLVVEITTDPAEFYQYINSTWIQITPVIKGDKGDKGDQGTAGAKGDDGSQWYVGSGAPSSGLGVVGDLYLNTANGDYYKKTAEAIWTLYGNLTGPQGEQGIQGIQGLPGADGADGADGLSAYEVAVDNGFVGTEEEWLISIRGEQGEQGIQGEQGPPGEGFTSGYTGYLFDGFGISIAEVENGLITTIITGDEIIIIESYHILTEASDDLITEDGSNLRIE